MEYGEQVTLVLLGTAAVFGLMMGIAWISAAISIAREQRRAR